MFLSQYLKPILRLIIILLGLPLIFCVLWIGIVQVRETSHNIAIQRISGRLGIPPSWDAFHTYLEDVLKEGMSREEVLQEFDKISPYTIKKRNPGSCDLVEFRPGILNISSYALLVCYDQSNTLKSFILHDY